MVPPSAASKKKKTQRYIESCPVTAVQNDPSKRQDTNEVNCLHAYASACMHTQLAQLHLDIDKEAPYSASSFQK